MDMNDGVNLETVLPFVYSRLEETGYPYVPVPIRKTKTGVEMETLSVIVVRTKNKVVDRETTVHEKSTR